MKRSVVLPPEALIDADSFARALRHRLTDAERQSLQDELDEDIQAYKAAQASRTLLYHGAPYEILDQIKKHGFRLTRGRRSHFAFGMPYEVETDNQAIFLATKESTARAFGTNRSAYGAGHAGVVKVFADIPKVLRLDNSLRGPLRKAALLAISDAAGEAVRSILAAYAHVVLDDPSFVELAKREGFSAVAFHEDADTLRELGLSPKQAGETVAVFDPARLQIERPFLSGTGGLLAWYKGRRGIA